MLEVSEIEEEVCWRTGPSKKEQDVLARNKRQDFQLKN